MTIPKKIIQEINFRTNKDFEPFYIYDSQIIRQTYKKYHDIPYANKAIHFATMSNINHDFLKIVKDEEIKVFVNSLMHMQAVQKAGFSKSEIIFTLSGLNKKTMLEIKNSGAQLNSEQLTSADLR